MSALHVREYLAEMTGRVKSHAASRHTHSIAVATIIWLMVISIGMGVLWRFANTPGLPSDVPRAWPTESGITQQKGVAHLVVFLHPQCSCSRATLHELAVIMARCQRKVTADVLFITPRNVRQDLVKTDLWQDAAAIPRVSVLEDWDGKEARRFGARTSGQTVLYDSSGTLRFQGGITISRGHDGANDGVDAIVSVLATASGPRAQTPVFGCGLQDSTRL